MLSERHVACRQDSTESSLGTSPRRSEAGTVERRYACAAEQLRSAVATLVFLPDGSLVVRGGPAARRAHFDRTFGPSASAYGPVCPRTTGRPSRNATLLSGGWRSALLREARSNVDGPGRRAGASGRHGTSVASEVPSRKFADRAAELGLGAETCSTARAAVGEALAAQLAPGTRPRDDRPRPAPGRCPARGRRSRSPALRLAGRATARAARCARGGGPDRRTRPWRRRCCSSTTCSRSSTSAGVWHLPAGWRKLARRS